MMIQVLVQNITPRIQYAVSLVLKQVLHTNFEIITDASLIKGFCINYSNSHIEGLFQIGMHNIVLEDDIRMINPIVSYWDELPVFFETDASHEIPFDIFAASFWLVSRYEEYTAVEFDKHGRFQASTSHAFQNNYLDKPVVNQWAAKLRNVIHHKAPHIRFEELQYRFVPTVDIDSMFKYRHKGFVKNTGGFFRDLLAMNLSLCSERCRVLSGKQSDPWDCLESIVTMHSDLGLLPLFFILAAKNAKYDKNISVQNKAFAEKVLMLKKNTRVGIHLSYAGHNLEKAWGKEKKSLELILKLPVYEARMHFLKLTFPNTFRRLIEMGVQFDFSLAYAETPGFRAGICSPFFFYDLTDNNETDLCIVPLSLMDVSMKKYLKLNYQQAVELIDKTVSEVKQVNGVFVSLWHNESFSESGGWQQWNKVYEYLLKKAQ